MAGGRGGGLLCRASFFFGSWRTASTYSKRAVSRDVDEGDDLLEADRGSGGLCDQTLSDPPLTPGGPPK